MKHKQSTRYIQHTVHAVSMPERSERGRGCETRLSRVYIAERGAVVQDRHARKMYRTNKADIPAVSIRREIP